MVFSSIADTPARVYITRQALELIKVEAGKNRDTTTLGDETGGILIGRRISQPDRPPEFLIVAATGPGLFAWHHVAEFAPDIDDISRALDGWRTFYPALDYIGTWHKHPSGFETFSQGDVHTAWATFNDPSYKIDALINPIVWDDDNGYRIRYYYMSRAMAVAGQDFNEFPADVVTEIEDSHPLVRAERDLPPWIIPEQELLQAAGYRVRSQLRAEIRAIFFTLATPALPDTLIYLVVPPEFAQLPPQVIVERRKRQVPLDDAALVARIVGAHGRKYHLVDVVQAVVAELQHSDAAPTGQPEPHAPGTQPLGRRRSPRFSGALAPRSILLGVVLLLASAFLFQWQRTSLSVARFEALWQGVDTALERGDEPGLRSAITSLEQIRSTDPAGAILVRNNTVTATLITANNQLGNLLITKTPPDLDGAEQAFRAASELDGANDMAVSGLSRVMQRREEQLQATATAVAQAELLQRWQAVEATADLGERVALIEQIETDAIGADPDGVSTARRLHDARLAYVALLAEQGDYEEAERVAQRALATDDPARLQAAVDALARVFLARAAEALSRNDPIVATNALSKLETLPRSPARALLDEAAQLTALAEGALTEENAIPAAWIAYDQAISERNFDDAVGALEVINGFTGPLPDGEFYAGYDGRTPQVGLLLLAARRDYAAVLKRAGALAEARQQYRFALELFAPDGAITLNPRRVQFAAELAELQTELEAGQSGVDRGEELWDAYTLASARNDLSGALGALNALRDRADFGRNALIPGGSATVATLIERINQRIAEANRPTARPAPAPTAPVAAPSSVAAAPSPTTGAAATLEPTLAPPISTPEPSPEPTASSEPAMPTAQSAPLVLIYRVVVQPISIDEIRQLYELRRPNSFCGEECNGFFEPLNRNVGVRLRAQTPGVSGFYNFDEPLMKLGYGLFEVEVEVNQPNIVVETLNPRHQAEKGKYYLISLDQQQ